MFEEEAEEIANKSLCSKRMCYNHCNFNSPKHHRCGEWHRTYECAKESAEFGYNKANEWHYMKDGKDLPLEAGLHIRVVLHNGNEYICETDYYEPSEDEIGFGHLVIQLYSNNEWIDDNDVYAWCELSMPPKKE